MTNTRPIFVACCLAVAVAVGFSQTLGAAPNKPKLGKLEGWVHMVSFDNSTITLRVDGGMRIVTFNEDTLYTYRNNPSRFEDVKEGWRVICVGKFNKHGKLRATRIDVRAFK